MQKGFGGDQSTREVQKFNHAIGDLGLDLTKLRGMAPETQFVMIGREIAKMTDPAKRTATAMHIFGEEGGKLISVFKNDSFSHVAEGLSEKGQILARNAAWFEQASIKLERVGGLLKSFYVGIADRVVGTLIPFLDRLQKINLVSIGQQFGDALVRGAQTFVGLLKDPAVIVGVFYDFIQVSQRKQINLLVAGFEFAGEGLLALLGRMPSILDKTTHGLALGLGAAVEGFGSLLLTQVSNAADVFRSGMEWVADNGVAKLALKLGEAAMSFAQWISNALSGSGLASIAADLGAKRAKVVGESFEDYIKRAATGERTDLGAKLADQAGKDAEEGGNGYLVMRPPKR